MENVRLLANRHVAEARQKADSERDSLLRERLASRTNELYHAQVAHQLGDSAFTALVTKAAVPNVHPHYVQLDAYAIPAAEDAATRDARVDLPSQTLVYGQVYVERYVRTFGAKAFGAKVAASYSSTLGKLVGGIVGAAERDGLVTKAQVHQIGHPYAHPNAENTVIERGAIEGVQEGFTTPRERFDKAQAALKKLDDELQLQLYEVGPAIYDANEADPATLALAQTKVKKYVETFRASTEYKQARARANAAAKVLGAELDHADDTLMAHVGAANKDLTDKAKRTLIESYEALAGSEGGAFAAVAWASANESDSRFTEAEKARIHAISELGQDTDSQFKLQNVQQLMQQAQAEVDAAKRKTLIESAISFIKSNVVTPYSVVKNVQGVTKLGEQLELLRRNVSIFLATPAEAQRIAQTFVAAARSVTRSPIVTRMWTGMGALVGMFNGATGARAAVKHPVTLATTAQGLYENFHKLKGLGGAARAGQPFADEVNELVRGIKDGWDSLKSIGTAFAILDIAGSVMSLGEDWERIQKYPGNVALQIKFAADIASTVGSVLCLIPPLAPLGAMISTIGSAISLIAGFFVGDPEGDERRGEEKRILVETGALDEKLATVFTHRNAAGVARSLQERGLATSQIHLIARRAPHIFEIEHAPLYAERLIEFLTYWRELGTWLGGKPSLPSLLCDLVDRSNAFMLLVHHHISYPQDRFLRETKGRDIARDTARALPDVYRMEW